MSPDEGTIDLRSALADLGRLAHRWRKALHVIATVDGVKHRDAKRIAQEALANTASVEAGPSSALRASAPEGIDATHTPLERQQQLAITYLGGLLQRHRIGTGWSLRGSHQDVQAAWKLANEAMAAYHAVPLAVREPVQSDGASPPPTPEGIDARDREAIETLIGSVAVYEMRARIPDVAESILALLRERGRLR